ncbi:ABC transporter substrate-binding protein [Niveibacterium umoris]|uniref:ABC transporter substrate-binding protein n=1 Tax=Niveibacterium umoris TaxID=1193620 RepID=UPI001C843CA5
MPPPIIVGQTCALSGPTQDIGRDYFTGAKLCFDATNAAGGINGRPVKFLSLDDGGDAARAEANAEKLLDSERADVLFGLTGDASVARVIKSKAFSRSDRALFAPMSGMDVGHERVFYLRATYGEELAMILTQFHGIGMKSVMIAHTQSETSRAGLDAAQALLKARNLQPAALVPLADDARNAASVAAEVARRAPQALVVLADTIPMAMLTREMRARNPGVFICALSNVNQVVLRQLLPPEVVSGVVVSRVVPEPNKTTTPVVREFVKTLERYLDEAPSASSLEGYLSARALVATLKKNSDPRATTLAASLRSLDGFDFGGWQLSAREHNRWSHYADTSVMSKNGGTLS